MKIGVSGDWHIDNMGGTYLVEDTPNREIDIKKQIVYMAETCKEQGVKIFIIAGDLFSRTITTGYYIAFAIDLVEEFRKRGMKVVLIPGNHDINENSRGLIPALNKLQNGHLDIIEKASLKTFGEIKVFFAPHERKENYKEFPSYTEYLLYELKGSKPDCIVGHFQPKKAIPGSEESMFAGSTRFVDTTKFDSIPMLVSHVHKPQTIDGHVYLIGSPVRFNMGERKEEKQFVIFDTEEGVKPFKLNCQKMSKISINLVKKDSYELDYKKIKKYKGHMIGIYIDTLKENRPKISQIEIKNAFEKVGAHVIQFRIKTTSTEKLNEKLVENDMSPESVFRRVVNDNVESGPMRKRTIKIGMGVLNDLEGENKK